MDNKTKKRRSFDLNDMKEKAESYGGKCLATEYKNSTYRLLFECKSGHKWRTTPLEIMGKKGKSGSWCPECTN